MVIVRNCNEAVVEGKIIAAVRPSVMIFHLVSSGLVCIN